MKDPPMSEHISSAEAEKGIRSGLIALCIYVTSCICWKTGHTYRYFSPTLVERNIGILHGLLFSDLFVISNVNIIGIYLYGLFI